ncbi:hypothetical protein AGLY_015829 [Aphis glycines]|uniref:Pre-C2HC domain-containing protein n=1 Tax=Aphis glycines TaxID=307491 RepID=A0A6G0SZL4_APHGL|nr:hypothetical protein AGLY_015829 [Aphis glycines]
MSNKNTVSPLIIQKPHIQSVPNNYQNKSPISPSTPTSRDGFSFPTNSKRLISPSQSLKNNEQKKQATYVSKNRFSLFATNETVDTDYQSINMDLDNEPLTATKPPPPIFIRTVNDYSIFCAQIKELIKCDNFSCKSSINGIKLSTETAESYRSIIRFLKENKADFHTYQLKQEKAYRVVLRNLHHTTPINVIKNELESLGHTARNITNVLQRTTKMPLPIFFIDLEPALNNKDIFKIEFIHYTKIKVEEPRFNNQTIQCLRFQGFGHTKSYCYHPPKCVRCGENHLSDTCQKSKSLLAKCALCEGSHPANYRGCPIHKEFQSTQQSKRKTYHIQKNSGSNHINVNLNNVNTTSNLTTDSEKKTYAQATNNTNENKNKQSNIPSSAHTDQFTQKLSSFLDDFKAIINPLISLLTTVINKFISNDK